MKNFIGRTILLVNDYERAAEFYERHFEFERIFDQTTDTGQRFLQLGDRDRNVGIWFLEAQGREQKERVGNQTAGQPTVVIYTDSLWEIHKSLKADSEAHIKIEPVIGPEFDFFHCLDYDGNEIVVVQLK